MTTAGSRIARLLTLVPWLRANDGITIEEAARHFDVTPDQLEKDLWLLVVCGLPGYGPDQLIDIDFWDDGHIHVRDPQTLDVPLRLTYEEATSLIIALRLVGTLPGAPDAVHSALERLVAAADVANVGIHVASEPDATVSAAIAQAIGNGNLLHLHYASGSDDQVTERAVTPLRVLSVDGRHLLLAYCHGAEAERTFRLDRILRAWVGDSAPVTTAQSVVRDPMHITCVLDAEARWVADVHPVVDRSEEADGRLRVRIPVHDPAWIVALMLRLGGAGEVIEPVSVRQEVAAAAQSALASYAKDPPTGRA